ncbi:hypothetical protein M3231_27335, partial [Neobacillus mesonae]|nr:hypothetical protein [Neobacillus mesonae]
EAVNAVETQIETLPVVEDITLEHAEAVADARAAFEGLTEAQQDLVSVEAVEKLVEVETRIAELGTEVPSE